MYINKSTKIMIASCAFLYFIGGVFHYIDLHAENFPIRLSAISYLAYLVICMLAYLYTSKNMPHRKPRRYLLIGIVILFCWMIVTMARNLLIPIDTTISRILLYLYYLPTLLLPNLLLLATLNYNKYEENKLSAYWQGTYLVTFLLIGLVITSDYHDLVFIYPDGPANYYWSREYAPLFYVVIGWMFLLYIICAVVMYSQARANVEKRAVRLAYASLGAAFLYFIWNITGIRIIPWLDDMYGVPEIVLALLVLSIAGCMSLGLIRANFNFLELFVASDLTATLVDSDGLVRYKTNDAVPSTEEQREQAKEKNVYISKNLRLRGQKLNAGYIYYATDLSAINRLAEELNDAHDHLEEENSLISAENKMLSRHTKADEQNRLYGMMAKSVQPELDAIEQIFNTTAPDSADFKEKLAEACIYKVFVKRYCNIMLLKQDSVVLNSFELESSIKESVDYMRMNGVKCNYTVTGNGTFHADKLLVVYSAFGDTAERMVRFAHEEKDGVKSRPELDIGLYADSFGLSLALGMEDREMSKAILDDLDREHGVEIRALGGDYGVERFDNYNKIVIRFNTDNLPEKEVQIEQEVEPA